MTSVSDPLVGHALNGRYEILEKLARGGMATVYRALDTRLGRVVAVKVMHDGLGDDRDFARKFDAEARAAARLSHPNVVSVFDQGHDLGRPYIVMEFVEGTTLRSVIVRDAPLPPLRALDLLDPVLSALAAAHEAGLVHRDVKPENVLISTRGHLKVADFGLARALSAQTATATQGMLIGTVSYVPPELVMSGRADTRSDVYSTGVVLFEMLTGRKPHVGDSPIQVAYAHVHNDVPAPSSLLPGSWRTSRDAVPPYLDALVQAATSRNPDERPRDARVLQQHLRRARAALLDGVMDDPELTERLVLPDLSDDERTEVVVPSGGLRPVGDAEPTPERSTAIPGRRPVRPNTTSFADLPRTPVSPQDFEHTLPPHLRLADEHTPVDLPALDAGGATAVPVARPRRRAKRLRLLLVALLVAVLLTAGWWLAAGRYTPAPALDGQPFDQAIAQAADAGVGLTQEDEFSETAPPGVVISTDPEAGTKVPRGSTIVAHVSRGPERFEVPRLVGLTEAAANGALSELNLQPGRVTRAWSETVEAGRVVSSSTAPGTSVRRDTAVDFVVSKGPQPIKIADYTNKDAGAAEKALTKAGFKVTVKKAHSKTVDEGDVVSQSPKSGTGKRGDTITLTRSLGPVMVVVPNVHKQGVNQARAVMEKAGFRVKVAPVKQNYLGLGYVSYASASFGSKQPEGSTITLYVV